MMYWVDALSYRGQEGENDGSASLYVWAARGHYPYAYE